MAIGGSDSGSGDTVSGIRLSTNMPTKTLIKAYASGTTTADAVVSTLVPVSGRLVGVVAMGVLTVSASATENVFYEISLQSASQWTSSDASGVIGYVGVAAPAATAGLVARTHVNYLGMEYSVQAGSRLYVHRNAVVAPSGSQIYIVWIIA